MAVAAKIKMRILNAFTKDLVDEINSPAAIKAQTSLVVGRNSFAAFQLEIKSQKPCQILLGTYLEPTLRIARLNPRKCDFLRLSVKHPQLDCQVWQLVNVADHADRLCNVEQISSFGGSVRLFCVAEVPATSQIGKSQFTISLFDDRGAILDEQNVDLEIVNYTFKAPKDIAIQQNFWQHPSCLARYYNLPLHSQAHLAVLENFLVALKQLGQTSLSLVLSQRPWDGQRKQFLALGDSLVETQLANLYEEQLVQVKLDPSTEKLVFDFTILKKYLELAKKLGINQSYDVFGLLGNWQGGVKLLVETATCLEVRSLKQAELITYLQALAAFFSERGEMAKLRIWTDEPDPASLPQLWQDWQLIKHYLPAARLQVALDRGEGIAWLLAAHLADSDKQQLGLCLSLETALDLANQDWQAAKVEEALSQGSISLSYYLCCKPQHPNAFLSSDLSEIRSLAYLQQLLPKLTGSLRWAAFAWPKDLKGSCTITAWPPGDSFLLYPGQAGQVEYSLRSLAWRRQREDVDLLFELAQLAKTEPLAKQLYQQGLATFFKNGLPKDSNSLEAHYVAMQAAYLNGTANLAVDADVFLDNDLQNNDSSAHKIALINLFDVYQAKMLHFLSAE